MRAWRILAAVALAWALLASMPAAAQAATPAKNAEGIQYREDAGEVGALMVRSLLVMVVIFGVAWAGVYLLRRRGLLPAVRIGTGRSVRVVESVRLGARAGLVVVEFDKQRLLLAESEGGVRVLARGRTSDGESP